MRDDQPYGGGYRTKTHEPTQEIYRREYGYDRVGNRLRRVRVDTSAEVVENLQYNGLGQLATMEWSDDGNRRFRYGYDRNGNLDWKQEQMQLIAGPWVQEASWDFIWDREDRLVEVHEYNSENVAVRSVESLVGWNESVSSTILPSRGKHASTTVRKPGTTGIERSTRNPRTDTP